LGEARPLNLRYTPKALAELADILAYLAERSPQGARNVQARIQAITALLVQYPLSGQLTSESGLRRIVTPPYPYVYGVTKAHMAGLAGGSTPSRSTQSRLRQIKDLR
jgi:toxin ParE1/3/4